MSKFQIGQEIQELKSRIERLEGASPVALDRSGNRNKADYIGSIIAEKAGTDPAIKPIIWGPGKSFPPFVFNLFDLPPNTLFNHAPESQTWSCQPEPLIVYVDWDAGGRDEHFRFANQSFAIIRIKDPNTGLSTATAIYTAQLIQRSGRSVDYAGGYQGPPYVPAYYAGPEFNVTLKNAGGAGLFNYNTRFTVGCGANTLAIFKSDFPAGLYDLVAGASWQMTSWRVLRC